MKKVVLGVVLLISIGLISCNKNGGGVTQYSINDTIFLDTIIIRADKKSISTVYSPKPSDIIVEKDFEYTVLEDRTVKVTKVNSSAVNGNGEINIPKVTSKGYAVVKNRVVIIETELPITVMGEGVLRNHCEVRTVNMPSIKKVEAFAFYECNVLEKVNMPAVKNIGESAFEGCDVLLNLDMLKVEILEDYVFYDCSSLIKVDMPVVKIIGEGAFIGCMNLESVSILEVETINSSAFDACYTLINVNMPKVKIVGEAAFGNCFSLINVSMPKVKIIEFEAFAGCTSLINLDISTVENIEGKAFWNCSALSLVSMPIDNSCCFKDEAIEDEEGNSIDSFGGTTVWRPTGQSSCSTNSL